jgi:pyrroline-5-carboxylate reductase
VASVLIIGAGNMGGALAKGLCSSPESFEVTMTDTHPNRLQNLKNSLKVKVVQSDVAISSLDYDALILCVKPQDLAGVGETIAGKINKSCIVTSILAGVTLDSIAANLKFRGAVVRAMPNICATVGEAATAMCGNDKLEEGGRDLVGKIFSGIGEAVWIKESLLDAVTGLSGSGPAYLYMIIEAMTEGGVKMGIPHKIASQLAVQTVLGSAKLVKETGLHPAVLRDQVTTPGGTTIHAIQELEERGLRAMLMRAVQIATERSANLRKE